jgi:hypothetical protein
VEKFYELVIRHRKIIFAVFIGIAVICAMAQKFVSVNPIQIFQLLPVCQFLIFPNPSPIFFSDPCFFSRFSFVLFLTVVL